MKQRIAILILVAMLALSNAGCFLYMPALLGVSPSPGETQSDTPATSPSDTPTQTPTGGTLPPTGTPPQTLTPTPPPTPTGDTPPTTGAATETPTDTATPPDTTPTETPMPPSPATPVTEVRISANRSGINWTDGYQKPTYYLGEKVTLTVSVYPKDATDKTYTITTSGAKATVNGDTVTGDAAGDLTITATAAGGVSGKLNITVVDLDAFAEEVFRLTNVERENVGLAPLGKNDALSKTAVVRAIEIITLFSHTRPNGEDPFTAFKENGVRYIFAGENIAFGQHTPQIVVDAWMNSPGHKANIMNPDFGRLGVGVAIDDKGALYWAQSFMD